MQRLGSSVLNATQKSASEINRLGSSMLNATRRSADQMSQLVNATLQSDSTINQLGGHVANASRNVAPSPNYQPINPSSNSRSPGCAELATAAMTGWHSHALHMRDGVASSRLLQVLPQSWMFRPRRATDIDITNFSRLNLLSAHFLGSPYIVYQQTHPSTI